MSVVNEDGGVLVILDDGLPDRVVVELGATEARRRRLPLRLAYLPPPADAGGVTAAATARGADRLRRIDAAAARIRLACPGVPVETRSTTASGGAVLADEVRRAELVVMGLLAQAVCTAPVEAVLSAGARSVIVAGMRGDFWPVPDGPVLVGVGGDARDSAALGFALAEADLRGVPLWAAHVWVNAPDMELASVDPYRYDLTEARRDAEELARAALNGWVQRFPQVEVRVLAVYGMDVAAALARGSRRAGLLVVGASRPEEGPASLGATIDGVLRMTQCPVAVVTG